MTKARRALARARNYIAGRFDLTDAAAVACVVCLSVFAAFFGPAWPWLVVGGYFFLLASEGRHGPAQ